MKTVVFRFTYPDGTEGTYRSRTHLDEPANAYIEKRPGKGPWVCRRISNPIDTHWAHLESVPAYVVHQTRKPRGRPLTEKQREHLEALHKAPGRGAYPGLSLGTLQSLKIRGLVNDARGMGSIFSPHTSIKWSLTHHGKKAIGVVNDA